jgi:hypothetical protein
VIDLSSYNISYFLLSSNNLDDVISVLYAKNYQVIPIKGYYKGHYEDSVIAFGSYDNDELRKDIIFLLNHFHINHGVIKYSGEGEVKKIFGDGSEKPMSIALYNTDEENKSYLYNGVSFSFIEEKRYWKPNKKEDFKVGMLVEYLNNNKWYTQKVENPSEEYDRLYKLLIKYDKIRVASVI